MYFSQDIRHLRGKIARKDAGFTLIEMMMVLLIIGVMSTAVLLTIPDKKPKAQDFTETLVRNLNLAAQTSLLSGQPAAFGLTRDGYVIYAYKDEAWAQDDVQSWPDNVSIRFEKDNRRLELPRKALPVIIFEPTGQSDVFRLTLRHGDQNFDLHSAGDGRIKIGAPL